MKTPEQVDALMERIDERMVQLAMYEGDWTIDAIASKIQEAYERKDSTP